MDSGYAVAMPTYTLCPENRIAGIVAEIGAGDREDRRHGRRPDPSDRPFGGRASGDAAGLHQLAAVRSRARDRIRNVVSISGLHDLRPLMTHRDERTLQHRPGRGDGAKALRFLEPIDGARVTCWVGGGERSEFIRQSALLANAWIGLGGATAYVEEPDRHHFNIIDGLADPAHPLTRTLLAD